MPPDLRSRGIKRYSEAAHNVLKYVILGISKDIQKALNIYMYKWLKTAVLAICYNGVGNRLKGTWQASADSYLIPPRPCDERRHCTGLFLGLI